MQDLASTSSAFAAIRFDGSVVTWGHPERGGDSSSVQSRLKAVKQIAAWPLWGFHSTTWILPKLHGFIPAENKGSQAYPKKMGQHICELRGHDHLVPPVYCFLYAVIETAPVGETYWASFLYPHLVPKRVPSAYDFMPLYILLVLDDVAPSLKHQPGRVQNGLCGHPLRNWVKTSSLQPEKTGTKNRGWK